MRVRASHSFELLYSFKTNTVTGVIHENKPSIQRGQKHLLRIHLMKCVVNVTKLF